MRLSQKKVIKLLQVTESWFKMAVTDSANTNVASTLPASLAMSIHFTTEASIGFWNYTNGSKMV